MRHELRDEGFVGPLQLYGVEGDEKGGEDARDYAFPCYAHVGPDGCNEEGECCGECGGDGCDAVGRLAEEIAEEEGEGHDADACEDVDGELSVGEGEVREGDFGDEDDGAG